MSGMQLTGALADRSRWNTAECSIAKAMEIVGTRSAILLMREAFYGTTRFDDFAGRVGITQAVAATRLKELTAAGLLEKQPYREPGKRTRHEYVLTQMGRDLLPAVLALMQWGDKYLQGPGGAPLTILDEKSDSPVRVQLRGDAEEIVEMEHLKIKVSPRKWAELTAQDTLIP
ncbi:winged helix-turn-helix transcriptional regulator [Antrihabitans sp. NCIMB 15449]|uniref:Winged helix-turn-helix transcriptional regulator n=1 Tax=Antrihabitans spumae TaxID=3373370 RepID=A0ABW7JL31_9NOCA